MYLIFTNNKKIQLLKNIIVSRKYKYYSDNRKSIINKIKFVYYAKRNNYLCNKNNIEIYGNFGKNMIIYHSNVIINKNAKIGDNVKLHGCNCIGNKFNDSFLVPQIGNNVEIRYRS